MSHAYYNIKWQEAMEMLSEQLEIEAPPAQFDEKGRIIKDQKSTEQIAQHLACLYVRYIQIFDKLSDCYDQIVHPQKRMDIKIALEVVMARLCEVKNELATNAVLEIKYGGQQMDFLNLDEMLLDLNLAPEQLEIPIPRYFALSTNEANYEEREKVENKLSMQGREEPEEENDSLIPKMTPSMAIKIIMRQERGRRGWELADREQTIRNDTLWRKKKDRMKKEGGGTLDYKAACVIQNAMQRWMRKLKEKKESEEELVRILMKRATKAQQMKENYAPLTKAEEIRHKRHEIQADNERNFQTSLKQIRISVKATEGPEMKDKMWKDQFQWYMRKLELGQGFQDNWDEYHATKGMPEKTAEQLEQEKAEKQAKKDEKKKKKGKDKKPDKKADKKGKKGKKGGDDEDEPPPTFGPTQLVTIDMTKCLEKYTNDWARLDESENYKQEFDENIARRKLLKPVQEELQAETDKHLLAYLLGIKEKQPKGKKKKGKKKKKKKKKKGKKKKGKKKKKKKKKCCQVKTESTLDLMVDFCLQYQFLEELPRPGKMLDEFIGGMNFLGSIRQAKDLKAAEDYYKEPEKKENKGYVVWKPESERTKLLFPPSYQQIRQCITEYCILPLGSKFVKSKAPHINSVLLYGPKGTGKRHLARSIAYHTNATWFDLSANKINKCCKGDNKGEIGTKMHMVFRAAQLLQPSVIFINNVDQIFLKKKSTATQHFISVMGFIKSHKQNLLTAEDRVLIVACSTNPMGADPLTGVVPKKPLVNIKELKLVFKKNGKMIPVPAPDYSTRLELWRHFIEQTKLDPVEMNNQGVLDLDGLAQVSAGYSTGAIRQAVRNTLPERRVQKLLDSLEEQRKASESKDEKSGPRLRPPDYGRLKTTEFLAELSKTNGYCFYDFHESYQTFTKDMSGVGKWMKALQEAAAIQQAENLDKKKKR